MTTWPDFLWGHFGLNACQVRGPSFVPLPFGFACFVKTINSPPSEGETIFCGSLVASFLLLSLAAVSLHRIPSSAAASRPPLSHLLFAPWKRLTHDIRFPCALRRLILTPLERVAGPLAAS
ncbi:hypothetical protein V8C35DRAFT_305442 [Trichoderma chlorosporum]